MWKTLYKRKWCPKSSCTGRQHVVYYEGPFRKSFRLSLTQQHMKQIHIHIWKVHKCISWFTNKCNSIQKCISLFTNTFNTIHKCISWFTNVTRFTNKWQIAFVCNLTNTSYKSEIASYKSLHLCVDFWNFPDVLRFTNAFFKDIVCSLSDRLLQF